MAGGESSGQTIPPRSAENPTNHHEADERMSLLTATNGNHNNGTLRSREDAIDDDPYEGDIDANDFDNLLARSESISSGFGIEPESYETPMLRGPRRYSKVISASRKQSRASTRRKSFASSIGNIEEGSSEDTLQDGKVEIKSPYLGGISVARFWIIFGATLSALFVSCFDSTIMVSSHPVITSYFKSSNSASWLSTAFLLTSTAFQPIFGRLSDTIGRKIPYVFTTISKSRTISHAAKKPC